MARVNEESHSFTCHSHVYPQVEWTTPAFTPKPQSFTALSLAASHFQSRYGYEAELACVAGRKPGWFTRPQTLTHPMQY